MAGGSAIEVEALWRRLSEIREAPPPAGLSGGGWAWALRCAAAFVESWGRAALNEGWTPEELLAVDPSGWARLDRRGAAFIANGHPILSLDSESILVDGLPNRHRVYRAGAGGAAA